MSPFSWRSTKYCFPLYETKSVLGTFTRLCSRRYVSIFKLFPNGLRNSFSLRNSLAGGTFVRRLISLLHSDVIWFSMIWISSCSFLILWSNDTSQLTNRLEDSHLPFVSGVLHSHNSSFTPRSLKKDWTRLWILRFPFLRDTIAVILSVLSIWVRPPSLLNVSSTQRIKSSSVFPTE